MNYWKKLGPGLITGAADDDPSGIATYSQAGARFGFGFAWLAAWSLPFMAVIQEMCARIGLVTGRGLAANIRQHYAKPVLYLCTILLLIANAFNIGADLGAMAASTRLVFPSLSFGLLVISFALMCLLLEIFIPYRRYSRYLKYLTFALLAYVISALMIHTDWSHALASAIIPSVHFTREWIFLLCAVLGTTISPYLFFWQTAEEIEEKIAEGDTTIGERQRDVHPQTIRKMRTDVWSGMVFSNAVMFFIMVASAGTLFVAGITTVATAADAAKALVPFAGRFAADLFAIGVIGTGLLAIPILAGSASYALSESFGWREGLYRKFQQAHAFYAVIIIAVVVGLSINFFDFDPMKALLYSAVLNGIIAPIILFFIIRISSNKKVMGSYANRTATTIAGWGITIGMALIALGVLWSLL